MAKIEKSIEIGGRKLTLSTGNLAGQATSAILARYGETVALVTVVAAPLREDLGYFPLSVEYQERLYAGGRIKGSRWVKREGRPTDEEILTARLIDRSIRPLFPSTYKKEVQVIITVLSVDLENNPDMLSAVAVSAALACSSIPWKGPIATLKVGMKDGSYFVNPLESQMVYSDMDLVVSTTRDAVVMIEAGANQVPEEQILGGLEFAQKEATKLIDFISDFAKQVGAKKQPLEKEKNNSDLEKKIKEVAGDKLKEMATKMATKEASYADFDEFKKSVAATVAPEEGKTVGAIIEEMLASQIRKTILSGKRPDGRKHDQLRPLSAEVDILPRTHGSAIFQRGQTQALTVTTLGTSSLEQLIETAEGEETKRYIHHYSMPPYSTGEAGRVGFPSRREIGHGALAERALEPVIPSETDFPYTIRVVTEILSSNGSTSMASVCGSTLSLMDAGVPIKAPVAGIAMGLIIEDEKKFAVLTDITGLEDGNGDMDFKVAGTKDGVTALQMDVKALNLTLPILKEAIAQAKKARLEILEVISGAISTPRSKVSVHAPKIKVLKVPQEKIGEIIGPGGKHIRNLIAETGAQIDIEDDGSVNIASISDDGLQKAIDRIEAIIKEVQPGEIYENSTVKRIENFGAFVEILPGKEGLVHISDMSEEFVNDPNDLVKLGDKVTVRVKEIDNLGRLNLSMVLDASKDKEKAERRGGGGDRGGGRRFDRRPGPRSDRGGRYGDQKRSSGPHFPTSRFVNQDKKDF